MNYYDYDMTTIVPLEFVIFGAVVTGLVIYIFVLLHQKKECKKDLEKLKNKIAKAASNPIRAVQDEMKSPQTAAIIGAALQVDASRPIENSMPSPESVPSIHNPMLYFAENIYGLTPDDELYQIATLFPYLHEYHVKEYFRRMTMEENDGKTLTEMLQDIRGIQAFLFDGVKIDKLKNVLIEFMKSCRLDQFEIYSEAAECMATNMQRNIPELNKLKENIMMMVPRDEEPGDFDDIK